MEGGQRDCRALLSAKAHLREGLTGVGKGWDMRVLGVAEAE